MPPWSGHGRPIRLALVSVPTAAHHGGNADSQAARPGKKSDGLPWTFLGNGIKINFGRSANSRGVGEDVAAPSSTNSMCAGPAAHLPVCWGRGPRIPHQGCQARLPLSAASLQRRCPWAGRGGGDGRRSPDKGSSSARGRERPATTVSEAAETAALGELESGEEVWDSLSPTDRSEANRARC